MALTVGSLLLYNGGANTTLIGGFPGVSISGNTAGVTSLLTTDTVQLFGGNRITLSQNAGSITISGASAPTQSLSAAGATITGTAISLDLEAGPFISLQTASAAGALSVTVSGSNQSILFQNSSIAGGSLGGTQNTASSTLMSFVAGANIGISQLSTSPTITISGKPQVSSVSITTALNGSTTGTLANITGPFVLVAGNQITLSQNTGTGTNSTLSSGSNAIVISGPSFSAGANIALTTGSVISIAGANIVSSLNGSSGALSISAGAGIGIGQANSTITISASASGTVVSGFQISGNTSGTSSLISNGTVYLQAVSMLGLSQSTTTGTASTTSNVISIFGPSYSGAGGLGIQTTGGVVAYAITNAVTSVNGSSGALSISAGAGIGIGQANSTITVSASVQTSSVSLTALGNTTSSSSGTFSNLLNISGAGIISVGAGAGSITISATTPSVTNYSTVSVALFGNTQPAHNTLTFDNQINISGVAKVTVAGSNNSLTISCDPTPTISYFEPFPLQEASPVTIGVLTATGTTAASAAANPFGSSLSLQRIWLPGNMTMTEVDLAFGINFPATNQGAGTMSQSFILYTLNNSTSLSSVASASRTASWTSGTTTSGTASTLQQGWAGNMIQPMTFASSTVTQGDYVVANLFSWAAANTSWTISVFGANAISTATASVVTNITVGTSAITAFTATPTSAGVLSSDGLSAASAFTSSSSARAMSGGTAAITALTGFGVLATANPAHVGWLYSIGSSAGSTHASTVSTLNWLQPSIVSTIVTQALSAFTNAPSTPGLMSSGGLNAGSFLTASTSLSVLSNAGTAVVNAATSASTLTATSTYLTSTMNTFGYNGSFGMTTNTTQATYLWGPFGNGIMLTGSAPGFITLSSTNIIVSGSLALVQPWFCLIGS